MAASSTASPEADRPLPPLRANLEFIRGAPTREGVPTWTIVDPVRHQYFQIEWVAYQMLQRWSCGTTGQLLASVARETTITVSPDDLTDLINFLTANHLTQSPSGERTREFVAYREARRQAWWQWLLHHYLFVKIPLARPHRFLEATLPIVAPCYTRPAAWLFGAIGAAGLWLVSQQWDQFLSTFLHFFNWRGAAVYAIVLCVVKVVHELGHAYTATRFGCRVSTIGVAVMALIPMLYSDLSDAYRVSAPRKRMWIAAAGVIAELGLAAVALLLWGVLPDGVWRSCAFVVATTSIVMSLSVNLNPLMRFDGYYLLADALGVPNLQDRAFAFGQWRLRELLFAPGAPPPEAVSATTRRVLIAYAWAVWAYRAVLYTGLAVMVYHFVFKLLGIVLFAVEVIVFIGCPVWHEVASWWRLRGRVRSHTRAMLTLAVGGTVVVLACMPWDTRVSVPGVLQAASHATVYPPAAGRIVATSVYPGQRVRAGDPLVILESPRLAKEMNTAEVEAARIEFRLQRQAGYADDRAQRAVLAEALNAKQTELDGLIDKQQQLVVCAPIDGVVTDQAESLYPGRWVNEKLALAFVAEPDTLAIVAMAPVQEVASLAVGQSARFIPDDLTKPVITARVTDIRVVDEEDVALPYLVTIFGGEVPVRKDARGRLQAEQSVYRVELSVEPQGAVVTQAVRGVVHVTGHSRSLLSRMWDRVVSVLVRESGL